MTVMDECVDVSPVSHYSAILRRNPSTSSRIFREKNLGNSVDDGVRDNGGMCCKAFLKETQTEIYQSPSTGQLHAAHIQCSKTQKEFTFYYSAEGLTACSGGQSELVQG